MFWLATPRSGLLSDFRHETFLACARTGLVRALACFTSAATWSLIVKRNRRRGDPDPELEAMASVLPHLLASYSLKGRLVLNSARRRI
jgi:hypothetical protein